MCPDLDFLMTMIKENKEAWTGLFDEYELKMKA
jgi:hypothetical protein